MATPTAKLMQVKPAAELFGVSADLIRDLQLRGELKTYRLGRRYMVDPAEVMTLAAKCGGQ